MYAIPQVRCTRLKRFLPNLADYSQGNLIRKSSKKGQLQEVASEWKNPAPSPSCFGLELRRLKQHGDALMRST